MRTSRPAVWVKIVNLPDPQHEIGPRARESDELDCVFCDIVQNKAPSFVIYEDHNFLAILDKYPISLGHCLVMPKEHYQRVKDIPQRDFCALYARVHALNSVITERVGASASHISINDGEAANQLIPHVHVHIIPRSENDKAGFTARRLVRPEEMEEIRRKLHVDELQVNA